MRTSALTLLLVLGGLTLGCGDAGNDTETDGPIGIVQQEAQACPPATTVLGIDIASYQHPNGDSIDWAQVAAARRFVVVKATEGTGYTNGYYADDVAQARAHGMYAGAYHWLHYTTSGTAQADYFINAIGGSVPAGDLPPMIDVEETGDSSTVAQRVTHLRDFADRVEQVTGRVPMIYSGSWYWSSSSYMGDPQEFNDHPFCWAAYVSPCPSVPDYLPPLTMWQYLGGTGSTPGIPNAACDQDMFYGTEDELANLAWGAPDYKGTSLGLDGQSYPIVANGAVTVHQGETVTGWVKLQNTGKVAWEPGVVWLAPIPRDQASPFAAANWQSATRISTVAASVAPGEVGQFELDIHGSVMGESLLNLGWVAEGITWFADPPKGGGPPDSYFAVDVNVIDPLPGTGGGGSGSGGEAPTGGSDSHEWPYFSHAGVPDSGEAGCTCGVGPGQPRRTPWLLACGAIGLAVVRRRR